MLSWVATAAAPVLYVITPSVSCFRPHIRALCMHEPIRRDRECVTQIITPLSDVVTQVSDRKTYLPGRLRRIGQTDENHPRLLR
jgi:hypothetical protein